MIWGATMATRGGRIERASWGLAVVLGLAGCPVADDGVAGDGSGSSDGTASTGGASDPGATSIVSGQTATAGETTGVDPDTTAGMESGSFITATATDEGPSGDLPNGDFCDLDGDCQSGYCYQIPMLGGVCSECITDADCETGSCQPDFGAGYAVCTEGALGNDCMSDRGCAPGLVCADVFGAGGLSPTRCSECSPDLPCPDGQGCTLNTDNGLLDAYLGCVDGGTVPLGETCPVVGGVGDGTICVSGECGVISIFMGFEIGVCSECDADGDCPPGQTCMPPGFGMGMLSPGVCG